MYSNLDSLGPCESIFAGDEVCAKSTDPKMEELRISRPRLYQTIRSAGISTYDGYVAALRDPGFIQQQIWKWLKQALYHTVFYWRLATPGRKAHNVGVPLLIGAGEYSVPANLFDGCSVGDIVVLNFGSLTCPIWRNRAGKLAALEAASPEYQFRNIYISEAHPKHWWEDVPRPRCEEKVCLSDAKTLKERISYASEFLKGEGVA